MRLASTAAIASDKEERPERCPTRHNTHDQRAQPVERDGLDDEPESQHEGEKRDVEGKADVAHSYASVHQGRHGEDDGAAECCERGADMQDRGHEEPDEGERHYHGCEDWDRKRCRDLGLTAANEISGEEPPQHDPLDCDRRQPRQSHDRPEAGEAQPAGAERQEVGQVRDGQEQRGRVRQVGARVGVRLGP